MLICLVAILIASAGNLSDPMVRYDDFPALFAEPEGFWGKTLSEGRWLNYAWHLRGIVTPSWLNFAAFQACWAVLCAATAALAFPGTDRRWFAVVAALTMLVSPPTMLIAPWFNTLMPGLAVVTLYAVLALYLPQRSIWLLLPPFTVAGLMAYTTLPIILLITCILATPKRSLLNLAGLVGLFVTSVGLALLCIYALNWQAHGVFGVVADMSRAPEPARGLAGLLGNLDRAGQTFSSFLLRTSYEFRPLVWFHVAMLGGSIIVMARHGRDSRLEMLYLVSALAIGLALGVAPSLKYGIYIAARAFIFAWLIYAILIVRAAEILSTTPTLAGRLARNAVLLITFSYLLQLGFQWSLFRGWQAETRAIAKQIGAGPEPVFVIGDIMTYPGAEGAGIQHPLGLSGRLRQLTGRPVVLCDTAPQVCKMEGLGDVPQPRSGAMQVVRNVGRPVVLIPSARTQ